MNEVMAYGTHGADRDLESLGIKRRAVGAQDVSIAISYCGVCHSDIHQARNEWGSSVYPMVPGHEIVGTVVEVGKEVSGFKSGDKVGVGCMVDSCGKCSACKESLEQFCENGVTWTYNSPDPHLGGITCGGYSRAVVVNEGFVLKIPETLDFSRVAPLLCAGITTWSPLKYHGIKPGDKVGIIGLGGLGHMGVKFARALGAETVMITRSPGKEADAEKLGASSVLLSSDMEAMVANGGKFDFLLDTIPVNHELDSYLELLKRGGSLSMVGSPVPMPGFNGAKLIFERKSISGSLIGGIRETQEMLDFCGERNILPEVSIISMESINDAYASMLRNEVKYRFVIDMSSSTF